VWDFALGLAAQAEEDEDAEEEEAVGEDTAIDSGEAVGA
jgi:hypothetical protein